MQNLVGFNQNIVLLKKVFLFFTLAALCVTGLFSQIATASAQSLQTEERGTWRGKVLEIKSQEMREIPGTGTEHLYQSIEIEIIEGPKKGEVITIENDYLELDKGDKFYFNYFVYVGGEEVYTVTNIDRRDSLIFFVLLFVVAVIAFGGWQGVRSLLALCGSFAAIFLVLIPGLLNGVNPLLLSFVVAASILFVAIFFTHGFNRESSIAYVGTMISVCITSVLAIVAVNVSDLSGFISDESVYLNFNTQGTLNFTGLLLGAIIIGVLGVLDDIAVTQAAVVAELYDSNKEMSRKEAYQRALRVGREHVGALVNTLVLAYTGVSLPLLLYFFLSPVSLWALINSEVFATEIIRTVVGSIGLILTVPIVTSLAVIYLRGHKSTHTHSHSHGHSHKH
jgi:uncharacterized membrane protein